MPKIEIYSRADLGYEYELFLEGSHYPLRNFRKNITGLHDFSQEDIYNLLSEAQIKKFKKKEFKFIVNRDWLDFIIGQRGARTKQELTLYPD